MRYFRTVFKDCSSIILYFLLLLLATNVVITMVQTRYCMIPISEEIKLAKKRAKILGKSVDSTVALELSRRGGLGWTKKRKFDSTAIAFQNSRALLLLLRLCSFLPVECCHAFHLLVALVLAATWLPDKTIHHEINKLIDDLNCHLSKFR